MLSVVFTLVQQTSQGNNKSCKELKLGQYPLADIDLSQPTAISDGGVIFG